MWYHLGRVVKHVVGGQVEEYEVNDHELTNGTVHDFIDGELEGYVKLPKVWVDWFDEISITKRGYRTFRY